MVDGKYTGKINGTPCYQEGKVTKFKSWLQSENKELTLSNAVFYSDSINDLPLLAEVSTAIAVDPDLQLRAAAEAEGWKILSLRT
jgi:phosphoserine phosphatase